MSRAEEYCAILPLGLRAGRTADAGAYGWTPGRPGPRALEPAGGVMTRSRPLHVRGPGPADRSLHATGQDNLDRDTRLDLPGLAARDMAGARRVTRTNPELGEGDGYGEPNRAGPGRSRWAVVGGWRSPQPCPMLPLGGCRNASRLPFTREALRVCDSESWLSLRVFKSPDSDTPTHDAMNPSATTMCRRANGSASSVMLRRFCAFGAAPAELRQSPISADASEPTPRSEQEGIQ
jgi:hypothetical protein